MKKKPLPFIIGITGASGSVYSFRLLQFLLAAGYNVALIATESGIKVINHELNLDLKMNLPESKIRILEYLNLPQAIELLKVYNNLDLASDISSGSFLTSAMIILPCSMNTLGGINAGLANNLLLRTADVCIKQNRKLILAPREMPFSPIHLNNMSSLARSGVKIIVPCPAFYHNPQTIDDIINYVVGKILDVLEVPNELFKRWE